MAVGIGDILRNSVKEKLARDEVVASMTVRLVRQIEIAQIAATAGFDTLYIDVFARWKLPLILCARTRLGTINHTLLSLEALRTRAIPVHGVAFIGDANDESERIICTRGQVKRLGRLPVIDPLTPTRLQAVFAKCFDRSDFA